MFFYIKKKKIELRLGVFKFVEVSGISVSISAIKHRLLALERTFTFYCTIYALALDRLQLCLSAH
jgi:hypothetical protein